MTDASSRMRAILESGYHRFRERLGRRLGSDALAAEALHETWLRIGRMGDVGLVQRPESYLFRMAINVATDQKISESRKLASGEIEALRHMMDETLDPQRIAEAREEMAMLQSVLNELTPRRKAILLLSRVEEMKHDDIARKFEISPRMVQKELLHALQHCSSRLGKKLTRRFGPGARKQSWE